MESAFGSQDIEYADVAKKGKTRCFNCSTFSFFSCFETSLVHCRQKKEHCSHGFPYRTFPGRISKRFATYLALTIVLSVLSEGQYGRMMGLVGCGKELLASPIAAPFTWLALAASESDEFQHFLRAVRQRSVSRLDCKEVDKLSLSRNSESDLFVRLTLGIQSPVQTSRQRSVF